MPLERRQSTATVGRHDYSHPYLSSSARLSTKQGPSRTPKRELGLMDLFLFKMFGCFQNDDMPPPNTTATVHQNGRESSASTITTSVTNTNTTTTASALSTPEAPKKGKKNTKASKSAKLAAANSWAQVPQHRATLHVGKEVARMPGEKTTVDKSKSLNDDPTQDKKENDVNQREEEEQQQQQQKEERKEEKDQDIIKKNVVETIVPLNDLKKEDIDKKESSYKLELDQSVPTPSLQGRVSRMSAMFEQE